MRKGKCVSQKLHVASWAGWAVRRVRRVACASKGCQRISTTNASESTFLRLLRSSPGRPLFAERHTCTPCKACALQPYGRQVDGAVTSARALLLTALPCLSGSFTARSPMRASAPVRMAAHAASALSGARRLNTLAAALYARRLCYGEWRYCAGCIEPFTAESVALLACVKLAGLTRLARRCAIQVPDGEGREESS